MQSLRSHWPGALLCFLGLLAASRGRVLPGAPGPDWQLCRDFSSRVNKLAWDIEGNMSLVSGAGQGLTGGLWGVREGGRGAPAGRRQMCGGGAPGSQPADGPDLPHGA